MLKYIKHNMESIVGIEIFPILSFLIFFIFFIVLFIWVARMKKADVNSLAAMPLNDSYTENEIEITTETPQS